MSLIVDAPSIPVVMIDVGPPVVFKVQIRQGTSGLDLTTVSAAFFDVKRSDGTVLVWSPITIIGADSTELILGYSFVSGDCPVTGTYIIRPRLTVPGGTWDAYPVNLIVQTQFGTF